MSSSPQPPDANAPADVASLEASPARAMRILLVEDEPRLLRSLAKALREYAILEYLALRPGEVVSRTTLYEHIFDETDDTLSNLIDVHVFSIRKKLRPDLIATHRGQGYSVAG